MLKPTLNRELQLWKDFSHIAGIDEVGRGPWAGPVVVAAVVLPHGHTVNDKVADSKLVTEKNRDSLYDFIIESCLDYGVGVVDAAEIDSLGILNATKEAARRAVNALKRKPDYLLCDALDLSAQLDIRQEAIIKGDQKIYSISCASIIAKVTRDRMMQNLPEEYSVYQFGRHKGYGTKLHKELLLKHGVSDIHRRSFRPVRELCE